MNIIVKVYDIHGITCLRLSYKYSERTFVLIPWDNNQFAFRYLDEIIGVS
jgi:hypothetical protein